MFHLNIRNTHYIRKHTGGSHSGTGSVTFTIDVKNGVAPWGDSPKTLNLLVAAYSTVRGTLTLERTL